MKNTIATALIPTCTIHVYCVYCIAFYAYNMTTHIYKKTDFTAWDTQRVGHLSPYPPPCPRTLACHDTAAVSSFRRGIGNASSSCTRLVRLKRPVRPFRGDIYFPTIMPATNLWVCKRHFPDPPHLTLNRGLAGLRPLSNMLYAHLLKPQREDIYNFKLHLLYSYMRSLGR